MAREIARRALSVPAVGPVALINMGHATRLVAKMPVPMSVRCRAVALLAACGLCVASCSRHRGPGALSPEQSMKTFHLSDPNVRVELFAAEPNVVDPVEVVFDEDGRAY